MIKDEFNCDHSEICEYRDCPCGDWEYKINRYELLDLAEEMYRCKYLSSRVCHETHIEWANKIKEICGIEVEDFND